MENKKQTNSILFLIKEKLLTSLKKLTFSKIIKFIFVLLIIAVYTLLFGRMFLARYTGSMAKYAWTNNAIKTYEQTTDFTLMTQNLSKTIDDNGYFSISNYVYIPEINEVQFTVRYNNSTVDTLENFYTDVSDIGETFVFTLTDNNGNVYDSYKYLSKSNLIYNFRRLVFEGVDLSNAGTLYLNVYYINDVSKSSKIYTSFQLYNEDANSFESDLKINTNKPKEAKFTQSPVFKYNDN